MAKCKFCRGEVYFGGQHACPGKPTISTGTYVGRSAARARRSLAWDELRRRIRIARLRSSA